ncbi:hypothetical protein K4K58_001161 [Colletotrichum sp. SAR11_239]|nr:hypothetical protein K4K58_001161 [Colletotrichum sp. SAR11_239]
MDAVTVASYVTNVNNHSLQNTKYHFALEDLHRAEEEKWTAQINSERKHSISTAHNAQLADLRAERDAAETEQVEAMSVSCSPSKMPHIVIEGTTGTPSLVSESSSQPLTQPSVVAIRPLRSSRTRSIAARHQPYFRSAVNILKWQMQQPEENAGEPDLEKLEAASVSERMVKSSEVEYLEETVPQDCEKECAEAKELLRKDKGDDKGANEGNGY